jgi:branched-chain amino acid transport system substrate-binding protein
MMTPFGPVKFENYNGFTQQNNLPTLVIQIINGKFETIWPKEYASHDYIYPTKPWKAR